MANYVELSKAQFEKGLFEIRDQSHGGLGYIQPKVQNGTEEYVYEISTIYPFVKVLVYSSVSTKTGKTRNIGTDAIRCVVEHKGVEIFKGTSHTKRLPTWQKNLSEKIGQLMIDIEQIRNCPVCNSVMTVRKGPKSKFWGCTKFPKCRHTEKY